MAELPQDKLEPLLLSTKAMSLSPCSTPDPPSTGVLSLPPEIVAQCLEMGALSVLYNGKDDFKAYRMMYDYLLSASLVCRAWGTESQRLLFKRIAVTDERKWRKLVESPLLKFYKTRFLRLQNDVLWLPSGASPFERFSGIEELELFGFGEKKGQQVYRALCSPGLRDLTSLRLFMVTITPVHGYAIPFSLRTLSIYPSSSYSTSTTLTLLSSLPSSSLKCFRITCHPAPPPDLFPLLQSIGDHLQDLDIRLADSLPPKQLLALSYLTQLQTLTINAETGQMAEILSLIPAKLSSLGLWTSRHAISDLIVAVRQALEVPAVLKLEKLRFFNLTGPAIGNALGGQDFLKMLEDKGIEVLFGWK